MQAAWDEWKWLLLVVPQGDILSAARVCISYCQRYHRHTHPYTLTALAMNAVSRRFPCRRMYERSPTARCDFIIIHPSLPEPWTRTRSDPSAWNMTIWVYYIIISIQFQTLVRISLATMSLFDMKQWNFLSLFEVAIHFKTLLFEMSIMSQFLGFVPCMEHSLRVS